MIDPSANLPDWNKPFNVSPEVFEEVYEEAMTKTEFAAAKRVVLRGRTKEVIGTIPDNSLDFAYIDGDHTLRGITVDLIKVLPKVNEGGLIGGDDFIESQSQHGMQYEPTLVCPFSIYFAEAIDLPIAALQLDNLFSKRAPRPRFRHYRHYQGRFHRTYPSIKLLWGCYVKRKIETTICKAWLCMARDLETRSVDCMKVTFPTDLFAIVFNAPRQCDSGK